MRFKITRGVLAVSLTLLLGVASGQDLNTQPKYGSVPKSDALKQSDAVFIASMDQAYKGDRAKAASDMSTRGWQYLQHGDSNDAMRRFNQAWLLNSRDGSAIWGMAAVESDKGEFDQSLKLLAEAEPLVGDNLRFEIDCARMTAMAGTERNDQALIDDAGKRFQAIYNKAHQNVINLQNWAIMLYAVGKYPEAWEKVKLAEATPDKGALDPHFVEALQAKMPRPQK